MIFFIKSLYAIGISLFLSIIGYYKKSLSLSGSVVGLIVGYFHAVSSYSITAALLTFFIFGSLITNFGNKMKESIEDEYKKGGQRTWIQVFSNSCCSTLACFLYISEIGIQLYDIPINYQMNPIGSGCVIAAITSLAASCGDTFSSEIGSVFSHSEPRLILNFRKVPRGTNGAVSIIGSTASGVGGFLVGISSFLCISFTCNYFDFHDAPPQWPLIVVCILAGFIGSFIDSVLGCLFQFSGINLKTGKSVNSPGSNIKHISGYDILDNHNVNLISSTITGVTMAFSAFFIWPILLSLSSSINLLLIS